MAGINSGMQFNPLVTMKKLFKKNTPTVQSQNFNALPVSFVNNNLLRFDPLDFVAQVTGADKVMLLAREQGGATSPMRFLQWGQNCCTGFELDPGGKVVFSGPFSGCSFLIARDPHSRKPIFLHSNDNSNQGAPNRAATLATQMQRAQQYLLIYHNGTPVLYHCSYEEMGMVPSWIFAVDVNGDQRTWDVYCVNLANSGMAPFRKLGQYCLL